MCIATVREPRGVLPIEQQIGGMSVRWLQSNLRRLALNILKRHEAATAEDLVQAGLEIAVKMAPSFDPTRGTFIKFIFARVHGAMVSMCRRLEGVHALPSADPSMDANPSEEATTDWLEELLVLDERAWLVSRMMGALDELPAVTRELVVGCALNGQSLRKLAAVQGISPEAAAKRYTRALRRLRAKLIEELAKEGEANRNRRSSASVASREPAKVGFGRDKRQRCSS